MKKESTYLYPISLIIISLWVLVPYIFTGFASADDIQYALNTQIGGVWDYSVQFAKDQGRFHFLISSPLGHSVYLFHNLLISKFFNMLLVLSNIYLVNLIIKSIFKDKWIGYIVFLFSLVFISGKGIYNPIVCYPMYFSGSFSMILLSLYFAVQYSLSKRNTYRILSAIIYAVGILFYETYLFYFPLFALILCYLNPNIEKITFVRRQWENIKICLLHILVISIYFIAYFGFRIAYPSHYGGATIATNFTIMNVVNATLKFASGAYPLALAFSNSWTTFGGASYFSKDTISHILFFIFSEHFEWICKSILVGILTYTFVTKFEGVYKKRFIFVCIIALLYVYIPHLPLALTQKYLEYGGFQNYVTTYFAFFAIMICLTLLLIFLFSRLKKEKSKSIYLFVLSLIIGLSSILNDYANYQTVKFLRKPMHIMDFMTMISQTPDYKALPDNTFIYSPQMYTNCPDLSYFFSEGFNWSAYFYFESGKKVTVFSTSTKELMNEMRNSQKTPYFFTYGRNYTDIDQYLAMGAISPLSHIDTLQQTILADSAVIYYYSNSKSFLVTFKLQSEKDSVAFVNNDTIPVKNKTVELSVNNQVYSNKMMRLFIKAKSIEMKSIIISNNCTSNGVPFELK